MGVSLIQLNIQIRDILFSPVPPAGLRRLRRSDDAEVDGEADQMRCHSGSGHRLVHVR